MGSGIDYKALLTILVILLVMYVMSWAFGVLQNWLMAIVSQKIIYTLRDEFSKSLIDCRLSISIRLPMVKFRAV